MSLIVLFNISGSTGRAVPCITRPPKLLMPTSCGEMLLLLKSIMTRWTERCGIKINEHWHSALHSICYKMHVHLLMNKTETTGFHELNFIGALPQLYLNRAFLRWLRVTGTAVVLAILSFRISLKHDRMLNENSLLYPHQFSNMTLMSRLIVDNDTIKMYSRTRLHSTFPSIGSTCTA